MRLCFFSCLLLSNVLVLAPGVVAQPEPEICDDAIDNDNDGTVDCDDLDCCDPEGFVSPACFCGVPFFVRSDADGDGRINVSDVVVTLLILFAGLDPPYDCPDALDSDDDGAVGITDAIATLEFLFDSGPPPPRPFPDCGFDERSDEIRCHEPLASCTL